MTSVDEPEPLSPGEFGSATGFEAQAGADVIIGEVPDPEHPTVMLWTARCSDQDHDLLGTFGSRDEAEAAKRDHLRSEHSDVG